MIFGKPLLLNVRPVDLLLAISITLVSFLALTGSPANAQTGTPFTIVTIGQGTLDSARNAGPRYVRLDFDPLAATEHTLTVTWDSNADVRFKVKDQDGTNLSPTIRDVNPGSWTGVLEADTSYFIGLWSTNGITNYTATIEAIVDVTPTISIISEPSDLTVNAGDNAEFTVEATGSDAISYQWSVNDVEITDATNANLLLTGVTPNDAGTYAVVVTDDNNGDFTLASAELIVVEPVPLTIISHPADLIVTEGDTATFTVEASGNGLLVYQWFANNVAIPDATDHTLTLSNVGLNESGNTYTVDISDASGSILTSDYALLTVDENLLSIVSEPSDLTVDVGDNAEFTVEAAGSDAISHQWSVNDVEIVGATNASLLLADVTPDDAGTYTVVITDDDNGDVLFASAELTVVEPLPLMIISHPTDLTVNEGDNATFTVEASGNGLLGYQWFTNNEIIPGATESTLTLSAVSLNESGNTYTVNVSDTSGAILSSDYALLTVDENPIQPTIVNLGQGILDSERNAGPRYVRFDFRSLAATEHTITVTWDSSADVNFKVKKLDGTIISPTIRGTNPGTWTGMLEANTEYFIGLWSTDGIANYTATIEADIELAITQQPTDVTVVTGDDAEFSVDATGRGFLAYQWFVDGSPITGENANSITVFATSVADSGSQYSVEVSNSTGIISSNVATLTVAVPPAPRLYSDNADNNAWMLHGPAPTLDFNASEPLSSWGRVLLRIDDVLLVGGDFEGIKPTINGSVTDRPWLAALNAITGQPVSTFQVPNEVDSVVRSLVLSPGGDKVYVGGDFGLLALDAQTGTLDFSVDIRVGSDPGRVLDIAVNETHIYIGGQFSRIENVSFKHVARLSHDGTPDRSWKPDVRGGFNNGREALIQAVTLSPSGDAVYLGGNFLSINNVDVPKTNINTSVSMLVVDTSEDASVRPERFTPIVQKTSRVKVRDIAVTEDYVIVAWGGPNHLGFHSHDGARLFQYDGTGDTQGLKVVGNLVYVAHHGEFFGSLTNPVPVEAVQSLDPEIVVAHKIHSFRLDAADFPLQQAWRIEGFFGVWGIAVADDSIWVSGQISLAGSNSRFVNGLARFPATGADE